MGLDTPTSDQVPTMESSDSYFCFTCSGFHSERKTGLLLCYVFVVIFNLGYPSLDSKNQKGMKKSRLPLGDVEARPRQSGSDMSRGDESLLDKVALG